MNLRGAAEDWDRGHMVSVSANGAEAQRPPYQTARKADRANVCEITIYKQTRAGLVRTMVGFIICCCQSHGDGATKLHTSEMIRCWLVTCSYRGWIRCFSKPQLRQSSWTTVEKPREIFCQ